MIMMVVLPLNHHVMTGAAARDPIDAAEENLNVPAIRSHAQHVRTPTGHDTIKIAPKDVATPLPPWNLSQIEKLCPSTAAKPATMPATSLNCIKINAATALFEASRINVKKSQKLVAGAQNIRGTNITRANFTDITETSHPCQDETPRNGTQQIASECRKGDQHVWIKIVHTSSRPRKRCVRQ